MKYRRCRVYPDRRNGLDKYYYEVCVFHSKPSMYDFRDDLVSEGAEKIKKPHKYLGVCTSYNDKKNKFKIGFVLFTTSSAKDIEVVSHEMTHAANYWWRSIYPVKDVFKDNKAAEMFARMVGDLVGQHFAAWNRSLENVIN